MAGMFKMDTVDALDSHGISHVKASKDQIGFPSISKQENTKKRILVQRNKTFSGRVQPTGHEYDFRRTPDPGRASPKKYMNGTIKPCVPADTPVDVERLHLNESPALLRYKAKEKLDIARCPTPMPMESEYTKHTTEPSAPQPTARSAWDQTNAGTADPGDLYEDYDTYNINTPRCQVFKLRDRVGRRFKPATKKDNYDVIMSDIEHDSSSQSPTPSMPLNLTENVLNYYNYHKPVNKDRRIARWLVDCNEKSQNQLPAHLPDINGTHARKNGAVSFEDV